jgi:CTP synthase (UTP-ammonia lyase)
MNRLLKIGIIGDLDTNHPSRIATDAALEHAAAVCAAAVEISWLPTLAIERRGMDLLEPFDGLFCAPGSPYESMDGALEGIRFAREKDRPFVAT